MSINNNRGNAQPEITIELDKKRTLIFDFNALCRLEELTGKNALNGETWSSLSAKDVRALLWSAMLREDPDLTIQEVGEMITFSNMTQIMKTLERAFVNAAVPEDSKSSGKK